MDEHNKREGAPGLSFAVKIGAILLAIIVLAAAAGKYLGDVSQESAKQVETEAPAAAPEPAPEAAPAPAAETPPAPAAQPETAPVEPPAPETGPSTPTP